MNPWTALLESLHSSLIDELTERRPEPKPELGMPQRHRALALPAENLAGALICEASFAPKEGDEAGGETRGFALLAMDAPCPGALGCDVPKLWDALIKRAGREFILRNIKPRLGDPKPLASAQLPTGFAAPSRVIWIPFKLNPGICYLGVGA